MSTEKVKPNSNDYYEKMDDGQVERQQLLNTATEKSSRENTRDRFKSQENNGLDTIRRSDSEFAPKPGQEYIRDDSLKRRTSIIEQVNQVDEEFKNHQCLYFTMFFQIGLINNAGYVVIGTAAQDLSKQFKKGDLMPMFNMSLILTSVIVKLLNAKYFLHIQHNIKIIVAACGFTLGYLVTIGAGFQHNDDPEKSYDNCGFALSLLGSLIVGSCVGLGDCTVLGFMKIFPSIVVSGYASGTGMAGVFGSLYYTLLSGAFELDQWIVIGCQIPLNIVYAISFWYVIKRRMSVGKIDDADNEDAKIDSESNETFSCENLRNAFRQVGKFMVNLLLIYVLEYIITTGWSDRAWRFPLKEDASWFDKNSYKVQATTYQIGVFFSRTSIQFFKVPWVTALTILQAIFFVLWMFIAIYPEWLGIYWQVAIMLGVGCMGGCSYSNCMYYVLECETLDKAQKEVTINIGSMFYDSGILIATLISLLISMVILPDPKTLGIF